MKNCRSGQSAIISEKDYSKIRREIKNEKFKLVFDVAWYTGERLGAVVQLKTSDISLDYITFRASTRKASPSGLQSTRQIPIHSTLNHILKSHQSNSLWLFPNKLNPCNHISLRAVDLALRTAVLNAGLEAKGISTHSFRRTFITRLHRAGIDIYTIQSITGHKDLTALRRYVEVSPERIVNAINLL